MSIYRHDRHQQPPNNTTNYHALALLLNNFTSLLVPYPQFILDYHQHKTLHNNLSPAQIAPQQHLTNWLHHNTPINQQTNQCHNNRNGIQPIMAQLTSTSIINNAIQVQSNPLYQHGTVDDDPMMPSQFCFPNRDKSNNIHFPTTNKRQYSSTPHLSLPFLFFSIVF